jgi:hypothetical protein
MADFAVENPEFGWGAQANNAITFVHFRATLPGARILQNSIRLT